MRWDREMNGRKSDMDKVLYKFKKGEKVKTRYGKIRTVVFQRDRQVFVKEEINSWYHPNNLTRSDERGGVSFDL
jgi:hypothetical protein